jgi:serine phosphatase RsbU (regulator of sigma subunit)/anti-sigma regulatory factor (Ser/Thr protein kinase)
MPDRAPGQPCVVDDPAFSASAAGAFFICDAAGLRLLAGTDNLAAIIGPIQTDKDLPEILSILDREAWDSLFEIQETTSTPRNTPARTSRRQQRARTITREDSLRYRARDGSQRWLYVRHTALTGQTSRRLVFARDATALAASRERLARAQSQEADASARLQAAVLVNGPAVVSSHVDYACSTIPSKLVDGDFLDVMRLAPDSLDIILGDVMGKGMEAAILGTVIKFGLFRSLATIVFGKPQLPRVKDICSAAELNITPHLFEQRSIATLAYGRLHEKAMVYEFVDCGHTAIVHYRKATDSCRLVKGTDMPLGFVENQDFRAFMLPYREGDVLIIYSDGLSECPGQGGAQFGEDKIMYVARAHAELSARETVDSLIRLGFEFSAAGFTDDVSLICIKARTPTGTSPASKPDSVLPPAETSDPAGNHPGGTGRDPCPADCSGTRPEDHGATEGTLNLMLRKGSSIATDRLRSAVGRALLALPCLDEEEQGLVVLACHEALANIIEHTLGNKGIRCLVQWRLRAGVFSIEFSYKGLDYDWSPKEPKLPIEEYGERGYGQAIMDVAMDSILLCKGFKDEKTLIMCRRMKCWME